MGEERGRLKIEPNATPWFNGIAISPDQNTLAAGDDKGAVRLWQIDTQKVTSVLKVSEDVVLAVAFSPNGETIAGAAACGKVYLWDVGTGKELHRLDREDPVDGLYGRYGLAFSLDGKKLAAGGPKVTVWDINTGKKLHQFKGPGYFVAFTPDGQTLAAAGSFLPPRQRITTHPLIHPAIYFWDLSTGRERSLVGWHFNAAGFTCLVLSPDGKTFVTGGGGMQVCLWEVATGKVRRLLVGHDSAEYSLAFSPDGRTLVTSDAGSEKIYMWDLLALSSCEERQMQKPSQKELKALWRELGGDDARSAYDTICTLVQWPSHSIPFLQERLQENGWTAVPKAGARKIARLIRDLDHEEFGVRQSAMAELKLVGEEAEPALRGVLAAKTSPELRRRAALLLKKLEDYRSGLPTVSLRELQVLRAIEVLEHIGTPEARMVLGRLARATPESCLSEEATAAVKRLFRRPAAGP